MAGVTALDVHAATSLSSHAEDQRREAQIKSQRYASMYRNRSGFARSPEAMRGEALRDFETPRDMRAPDSLLPYTHPHLKKNKAT